MRCGSHGAFSLSGTQKSDLEVEKRCMDAKYGRGGRAKGKRKYLLKVTVVTMGEHRTHRRKKHRGKGFPKLDKGEKRRYKEKGSMAEGKKNHNRCDRGFRRRGKITRICNQRHQGPGGEGRKKEGAAMPEGSNLLWSILHFKIKRPVDTELAKKVRGKEKKDNRK